MMPTLDLGPMDLGRIYHLGLARLFALMIWPKDDAKDEAKRREYVAGSVALDLSLRLSHRLPPCLCARSSSVQGPFCARSSSVRATALEQLTA